MNKSNTRNIRNTNKHRQNQNLTRLTLKNSLKKNKNKHIKKNTNTMKNANRNNKNMNTQPENLFVKTSSGSMVYKYYKSNDDSTINKDPKRCMCINYKSMDDFNTFDRCPNAVVNNTYFCQLHQNCRSYLRQFLSGSEPIPDKHLWNNNPLINGSHNCYSYFLNRQNKAVVEKCNNMCAKKYKSVNDCIANNECSNLKPQPGDFDIIKNTGSDINKTRIYNCQEMQNKILRDNPSILPVKFNQKCPVGYYKGAMTVEPNSTFHFYKQVGTDGNFFHKPGISNVSNVDAPFEGETGRQILIPHFANRDYTTKNGDGINYTEFCGYYCIPQNNVVHKNLA